MGYLEDKSERARGDYFESFVVKDKPTMSDTSPKDAELEKLMVELLSLGCDADRASSYEETCAIDDRIGYVKAQIRKLAEE